MTNRKVIAGPAGHWYAVVSDSGSDTLLGLPMMRGDDETKLPPYPPGDPERCVYLGWYEITDPVPECDTEALIAALTEEPVTS